SALVGPGKSLLPKVPGSRVTLCTGAAQAASYKRCARGRTLPATSASKPSPWVPWLGTALTCVGIRSSIVSRVRHIATTGGGGDGSAILSIRGFGAFTERVVEP